MILDIILMVLYAFCFSGRMLQTFQTESQPFALWMLGAGAILALIEMQILRGYIRNYIRKGWSHYNTLTYLIASIPLLALILIPTKQPSDLLFLLIIIPAAYIPLYFVKRIFNRIIENNESAGN
ncbi:hypothetical protein [Paenibacillus taichungensis]